jgi:spore coat polysaccharide biosynthesis protein SpsF|tara:strand:- start:79 stop:819 length:741 start_codon:yes stop_codon:yes gene_type:complete
MNCIFISVRNSSTRLPNKAILDLCGKPTIQHLIESMMNSRSADKIILCTSDRKEDDVLCNIASGCGIEYFRGSLNDKLIRWRDACKEYKVDFFVNVDGDDLFFDVDLADIVIDQYKNNPCDFIDGHGLYNDVYGIKTTALNKVCEIKDSDSTEYIRLYFTETGIFQTRKIKDVPIKYIKGDIRMTLDYPEDFEFFKKVIEGVSLEPLTFDNILKFIYNYPETSCINFFLEEDWKINQEKIKHFKIK